MHLYYKCSNPIHSAEAKWMGFCLLRPRPKPHVERNLSDCGYAIFQIAAITYFVCVSTFTPEQDSKSTRISMDVLPTIY